MNDPLAGCWAKLARADELIAALETEVAEVRRGRYLRFSIGGEDGLALRVHVKRQPPFDRWGVLVGEIVHDLRSALDHLTWALTIAHSGPPPKRPAGWWRSVEFPIFTDRALFFEMDRRGRPTPRSGLIDLRGINPALLSRFEALQPFEHGARAERQPLAILHAISVRDKHQALPLVAIAGRAGTITAQSGSLVGRSRAVRVAAPIQDGAVIARLRNLQGYGEARDFKIGETVMINFKARIDFEFGFAAGPPGFAGELIATTRRIHRATSRVLRYFSDPDFY